MVAISLPDIPPDIQLQIAEFAQSSPDDKSVFDYLSLSPSRSTAQYNLCSFEMFYINLGEELKGSIDDLFRRLTNTQHAAGICGGFSSSFVIIIHSRTSSAIVTVTIL